MNDHPGMPNTHNQIETAVSNSPQPLDYFLGLQSLVNALSSAWTVEAVADAILSHAFPIMGTDIGMVVLLSEDGKMLETLRHQGVNAEQRADGEIFPISVSTPLTMAVKEQRTVQFQDKAEFTTAFPAFSTSEGLVEGAVVAVPMLLENHVIGAIGLSYRQPRTYSVWDVAFRETVATQCAQAIERARLHAERVLIAQASTHQSLSALLRGIIDGTTDLIAAIDLEGRYLAFNKAYEEERLHKFGMQIVVGMSLRDAFAHLPEEQERILHLWNRALAGEEFTALSENGDAHGGRHIYEAVLNNLRDREGHLIGAAGVFRDTTERVNIEQALIKSEARLKEAQSVAQIGSWELEVASEQITWSEEMFRLMEFDPADGTPSYDQVVTRIHSDDVPVYHAAEKKAIEDEQSYNIDIRIRYSDGRQNWVQAIGRAEKNEDGKVVRLLGTVMNITERKQAEQDQAYLTAIIETTSDFVARATPEGEMLYCNRALRDFLGVTEEEVQTLTVLDIHAPQNWQKIQHEIFPASIAEGEWSGESVFVSCKGQAIPVSLKIFVHKDNKGKALYRSAIARDISKQKVTEETLRQAQARLEEAQRAAQIGSWEYDLVTQQLTWSKELFRIKQRDPALGEPSYEDIQSVYVPEDAVRLNAAMQHAVENGVGYELELRRVTTEGTTRYIRAIGNSIADEAGKVVRLAGTSMDITEYKQLENALRTSEACLRDMVENLPAGAIFVDGERILLNRAAEVLTGYSREDLPTVEAWFHALYRDSAETMYALYEQDRASGFASSSPTIPLFRKDGTVRQVQFAIYAYTNGEVWLLYDLTERTEAESTNARLATPLEASPDFVGTTTQEVSIIYLNSAFCEALGVSQEEIASTHPHISRFMPAWAVKQIEQEILPAVARQGHWQGECALLRPDGTEMPVSLTMVDHKEIDSDVNYISMICRDITTSKRAEQELKITILQLEHQIQIVNAQAAELEKANQRLTTLAMTDGLTGLYNHRAFQEEFAQEFERTKRYSTPLSIILLDVDKFKQYNDIFGHPEGDDVLKTVAQALQQAARDTDYICRYGGEEFVIILPNTGAQGAIIAAERFRAAIEQRRWTLRPVTASLGIATLDADLTTAQELIVQADKALYDSKKKGRNCFTHFATVSLTEGLGELAGNTRLPYSDIVREMLQIQQDTLVSASEPIREAMTNAYDATILSWSRLLPMKDKETEGHSKRVTEMMVRLAHSIGMNEEEALYARWGALLHDVGKMSIPDSILHKPGPLTAAEWVIMRQHITVAYEMLSPISFLRPALDIPLYHHEKWDGTGYPRGLKGQEIPLPARLFAVIDVYDALTNDRPYREAWSQEKTLAHLQSLSGTHFDPRAVNLFLAMLKQGT
jgi:diguanylate cyclase (GGDEF)-like protein/PAS domain S-box-containing protein/putative nucleotidyltransferase with HDIG domain